MPVDKDQGGISLDLEQMHRIETVLHWKGVKRILLL
jgi:hypothetical protein